MVLGVNHLALAGTLGALDDLLSSQHLMPMMLLGVAAILLMRRPRRPPSTPPSVTAARALSSSLGAQDRIRRDLEALMVELQELSRKIGAEVDTRFAKLEAAMRDADRRIAALTRLSREPGQSPPLPEDLAEPDVRHQIVYELADAGKKAIEIARELGKTPGEVELILNLRGKMAPTPAPPISGKHATPSSDANVTAQPLPKPLRAPRERKKAERPE